MNVLSTLCNVLLTGASAYAVYRAPPFECPLAFSASVLSLCHGLVGLINSLNEETDSSMSKANQATCVLMEILQAPLVNLEIYFLTNQSNISVMGHCFFIFPLLFYISAKELGFNVEGEQKEGADEKKGGDPVEALKHLTILGSIVSMIYLACNEDGYYLRFAWSAFNTKYISMFLEYLEEGVGKNYAIVGHAEFILLTSEIMPK